MRRLWSRCRPAVPPLLNRRDALRLLRGAAVVASGRLTAYAGATEVSPLPFDFPSGLAASGRNVFAHWHFFPISFDNRRASDDYFGREFLSADGQDEQPRPFGPYALERPMPRPPRAGPDWLIDDLEQDVRWAGAIGIDAFVFNIIEIDTTSDLWLLPKMLTAAGRVGGNFRVIPSLDTSILKDQDIDDVATALKTIGRHPMWFRAPDGKLLLGAFMAEAWPTDKWRRLFAVLAKADMDVQFFPTFLNVRSVGENYIALGGVISEWGGDFLAAVPAVQAAAADIKRPGRNWCAPVWPQDVRPKDGLYTEAGNSRLFRSGWQSAIDSGADAVQIITWNDYSEGSEIRPSTGIQYSFYDLAAFFIAWFKTGRPPKIIRDVLYYFHRAEPVHGARSSNRQQRDFTLVGGGGPADDVELLGFLAEPGELEIELNGTTTRKEVPAGVSALYVPLALGQPLFRLKRDKRTVIEFRSAFAISGPRDYQDLLYRGGSSTRRAIGQNWQELRGETP